MRGYSGITGRILKLGILNCNWEDFEVGGYFDASGRILKWGDTEMQLGGFQRGKMCRGKWGRILRCNWEDTWGY